MQKTDLTSGLKIGYMDWGFKEWGQDLPGFSEKGS
jgi:hypothetical protein